MEIRLPAFDLALIHAPLAAVTAGGVGVLVTGLLLGIRHGFDWDHIAAITDITSTSAAADVGAELHEAEHLVHPHDHAHGHGGAAELSEHDAAGGTGVAVLPSLAAIPVARPRFITEQRHAIALGTLYALGHALVVFALGMLALAFGAILPDWVDPIMGRVVGVTLLVLGIWVFVWLYQYLRNGTSCSATKGWMLVLDGRRRLAAAGAATLVHGHEHVAPLEMQLVRSAHRVRCRHDPRHRRRDRVAGAADRGRRGCVRRRPRDSDAAGLRRRARSLEHGHRRRIGDGVRRRAGPPAAVHHDRRARRHVQHCDRPYLPAGREQPAAGSPAASRGGASMTGKGRAAVAAGTTAGTTSPVAFAHAVSAGPRSAAR